MAQHPHSCRECTTHTHTFPQHVYCWLAYEHTRSWAWVGSSGKVSAVTFEQLRTNVMNMKFWDRCLEEEIVTDAGFIRKCMV